jgi:hypothetical protein
MKATVIKVEQADGFVNLTIDCNAVMEIERAGEFEPTSSFDEANGAVSFNLFTDEIFSVGDTFVSGEWVKCEVATGKSTAMKTFGPSFMNRELDRKNSE